MDTKTLIFITPEILVTVLAILILLFDIPLEEGKRKYLAYPAVVILLAAAFVCATFFGKNSSLFYGTYIIDSFSVVLKVIMLAACCLVMLLSVDYLSFPGAKGGEYYSLVLFALVGMMIMISANDLIILFLGLQLNSIPLYILSGFEKFDAKSNEASLKYLLMGIFAAVIMLYGMSLVYGLTQATTLSSVGRALGRGDLIHQPALFVAMVFVLLGFTFKIAVVPFHFWAPDVYEGAPTPIAGFIATAPKCAGLAAILRILTVAFPALVLEWRTIFMIFAVLSMTIGNVVALGQKNIKRMLAFSSVAHVGYILVAIVAGGKEALSAIVFYLAVYALITLGAFAVVVATTAISPEHQIADFAGLSERAPFLAFAMATFMVSLLGIPPSPGFWGKFLLFRVVVEKGLIWLAVIAIVNCVISAVYYVNVVRCMYLVEAKSSKPVGISLPVGAAILVILLGTLAVVYPAYLVRIADAAKLALAQF